jgi:hypothetical protein
MTCTVLAPLHAAPPKIAGASAGVRCESANQSGKPIAISRAVAQELGI